MNRLFRREVIEAQQAKWLGEVSIAYPIGVRVLATLAMLIAASASCFLFFGEYTHRTKVVGQLVPNLGLISVVSPMSGVVSDLTSIEGDVVPEGFVLAKVIARIGSSTTPDLTAELGVRIEERARATSEAYETQLAQLEARESGLVRQLDALREELSAARREQVIRRDQASISNQSLERLRALHREKYVTALQLQQQESQMLEQQASVQSLQRAEAMLSRQAAALEQELALLPAERLALMSSRTRDLAAFAQERLETSARSDALVRTPSRGRITSLVTLNGQSVQAGQTVATLLPSESLLEAHLLVPSRVVGFLELDSVVRLRYQAFPYQKFGQGTGRILRVSRSALSPSELAALGLAGGANEPLYRVIVQLDSQSVRAFGRDLPLKPGMALEADVMGERRRLWEWVLEPLYSVSGRL